VLLTPLLGRADESVEDAPTHQTEVAAAAAGKRETTGVAVAEGLLMVAAKNPLATIIMTRTRRAVFI
jgi:hypothetical protein